mgnify:CR=1 FL=1
MTTLARRVRRVVPHASARPLVILLHPPTGDGPAELEIRELGRRKGPRISIARLYTMLHRQAAGLPAPTGRKARRVK